MSNSKKQDQSDETATKIPHRRGRRGAQRYAGKANTRDKSLRRKSSYAEKTLMMFARKSSPAFVFPCPRHSAGDTRSKYRWSALDENRMNYRSARNPFIFSSPCGSVPPWCKGLCSWLRRSFPGVGLIERGAQPFRQFYRVVIGPEMHEEQARLFFQHVAVNGRNLNALLTQRLDHRIDFAAQQNEISGDGGLAPAGRLKVHGRPQAHGAGNRHAGVRYLFGPGNSYLIDASVGFAFSSERRVDGGRIEIESRRSGRCRRRRRRGLRQCNHLL